MTEANLHRVQLKLISHVDISLIHTKLNQALNTFNKNEKLEFPEGSIACASWSEKDLRCDVFFDADWDSVGGGDAALQLVGRWLEQSLRPEFEVENVLDLEFDELSSEEEEWIAGYFH